MTRILLALTVALVVPAWAEEPTAAAQPSAPAVQPSATPAPSASAAEHRPGAGSLVGSLLPLLLIFAVLYFVMILPQQRRQKKHQAMLQALKRGDRVVLSSGILGIISEVKDVTLMVKVAENTVIEVEKGAVTARGGSSS